MPHKKAAEYNETPLQIATIEWLLYSFGSSGTPCSQKKSAVVKQFAALLVAFVSFANPVRAESFDWLIAPYGWLPGISVDQAGTPDSEGGGGVSGSDILEKTESVFMFRFEAARNRWGLLVDYITLGLADQSTLAPPPPFDIRVDINGELDLDVAEVAAFYRPSGEVQGVNFLFGVRQISAEQTLFLSADLGGSQRIDTDSDVTDIYVGARYLHRFSDRWGASIRGDVSFGDSEGTLNMLASVGYRVAGPFALQLGYRYATISLKEDVDSATLTTDITLDGPYLGFVFRF